MEGTNSVIVNQLEPAPLHTHTLEPLVLKEAREGKFSRCEHCRVDFPRGDLHGGPFLCFAEGGAGDLADGDRVPVGGEEDVVASAATIVGVLDGAGETYGDEAGLPREVGAPLSC